MKIITFHFLYLLLLITWLTVAIEGKNVVTKANGDTNTFIAAVYEHLPILALPVCYEKGILDKLIFSISFNYIKRFITKCYFDIGNKIICFDYCSLRPS